MSDSLHKITIGGEQKEIKMSYGLLNELCQLAGDIDVALTFALNNDIRNEVLLAILSERDERGKVTSAPNLFYLDADHDEVNDLLDWAGAHVTDFFLRAAQRTKATALARKSQLEALQST